MVSDPFISVIITAFDRKEFLLDAVNSALDQTLDSSFYEVIVVKNFKDLSIDRILQNDGVQSIYVDSSSGGEKFLAGINRSKGEVLSFLDDDDTFTRDKLEYVRKVFSNDNAGYFHNGMTIEDDQGSPLAIKFLSGTDTPLIVRDRLAGKTIEKLMRRGAWFNSSSISIRKAVILPNIDRLSKVKAVTDSFLFYSALITERTIIFDPVPLTNYRVHNSLSNFSGSIENFASSKTYLHSRSYDDFLIIVDMLTNTPYRKYASAEASIAKFLLSIASDLPETRPEVNDFIQIFRIGSHLGRLDAIRIVLNYILSIFNRDQALKIFLRRDSKRFVPKR